MRIPVRRPSPAFVIACLALLVALGGTSYATVLQVPRNSVGAPQLKTAAVTSKKIAANAVTSAKVQNGTSCGQTSGAARSRRVPQGPQARQAPLVLPERPG